MYDWQVLLNDPNVIFEELSAERKVTDTAFEESILKTEELLGQSIPEDYKTFCKISGNVGIDEFVTIYSPNFWMHRSAIDSCKDDIEDGNGRITKKNTSIILTFLEHALWFGNTDRADLFFDLGAPNLLNKSCPVYIIQRDPKRLHLVSDSFFDFVTLFCYGNFVGKLPKKLCPKYTITHKLEQFNSSFTKAGYEFGRDSAISMTKHSFEGYSDDLWSGVSPFKAWTDD
jgi:hypothetical protein